MKALNFKLQSTNGKDYSLKNSIGKYVVIYFYPKDDTPGCTIETKDFNKLLIKFKKLDCEIYGISKDSLKSHNKFKNKHKIKFDLLIEDKDLIYSKLKIKKDDKISKSRRVCDFIAGMTDNYAQSIYQEYC